MQERLALTAVQPLSSYQQMTSEYWGHHTHLTFPLSVKNGKVWYRPSQWQEGACYGLAVVDLMSALAAVSAVSARTWAKVRAAALISVKK